MKINSKLQWTSDSRRFFLRELEGIFNRFSGSIRFKFPDNPGSMEKFYEKQRSSYQRKIDKLKSARRRASKKAEEKFNRAKQEIFTAAHFGTPAQATQLLDKMRKRKG